MQQNTTARSSGDGSGGARPSGQTRDQGAAGRVAGGRALLGSASGGAVAPLGTVAKFASGDGLGARPRRFMVQSGARELMPDERVAVCLRRVIPGAAGVSVLYSPKHKAAHFGGLQVCGSVWMCAVCAAKIAERRREELTAATGGYGGQIALASFTLQHKASDALHGLLNDLLEATRASRSGRAWVELEKRYGVVGSVRSLEVTYGKNGWHPHNHVLFFLAPGADVDAFAADLRRIWLAAVKKVGRYAHEKYGLDVRASDAQIADYVAKWGKDPKWTTADELTKAWSKRGRAGGFSMVELLELYVLARDRAAGALWQEYARAFKGRSQLRWSRGLRASLGLIVEEKTDQELVEETVEDAVVLAFLTPAQWRVVLGNDARGELLDVASSGDVALVESFLLSLGVVVEGLPDG